MKRNTNNFESNLRTSFSLVRNDINRIDSNLIEFKKTQERIWEDQNQIFYRIKKLEERQREMLAFISSLNLDDKEFKRVMYIGNKKTGEFHEENCILARGTEENSKIIFESAFDAKRYGFDECICLY